jgi:hypothetical protein
MPSTIADRGDRGKAGFGAPLTTRPPDAAEPCGGLVGSYKDDPLPPSNVLPSSTWGQPAALFVPWSTLRRQNHSLACKLVTPFPAGSCSSVAIRSPASPSCGGTGKWGLKWASLSFVGVWAFRLPQVGAANFSSTRRRRHVLIQICHDPAATNSPDTCSVPSSLMFSTAESGGASGTPLVTPNPTTPAPHRAFGSGSDGILLFTLLAPNTPGSAPYAPTGREAAVARRRVAEPIPRFATPNPQNRCGRNSRRCGMA